MTKRIAKKTIVEIPVRTPAEILAEAKVARGIVAFTYQGAGDKEAFQRIGIPTTFYAGHWHLASLVKEGPGGMVEEQGKSREFDPLKMSNVHDWKTSEHAYLNEAVARAYAKIKPMFDAQDRAQETSKAKREREEKERNERMQAAFTAREALKAAAKTAERPAF